ncbi:MAG: trypsin-like peptidase domain-containing protein [Streptosporangiaceae bacterium]
MSGTDPLGSAVLITSSDPDNHFFGTGFIIYRRQRTSYVLTCAHVIDDIGGADKAVTAGVAATPVASGDADGIDLAILRCEDLDAIAPLQLKVNAERGQHFQTTGFQLYGKQKYLIRSLAGLLGKPVQIGVSQAGLVKAWDLNITDDYQLQPGYSGSPVVDENGDAIAVVSTRQAEGRKGLAVSVEAVLRIWPDAPRNIFRGDQTAAIGQADGVAHRIATLSLFAPPPALGDLIGRERLVRSLTEEIIARHVSVLALQGIGGVGKTSVAVAVARQVGDVLWVDCAREEVTFEKFVLSVVALAASHGGIDAATFVNRYQDVESRSAQIVTILADHRHTIVFDDFHLVANQHLKQLLLMIGERCPGITLIFTSRAWLEFLETTSFLVPTKYVQLQGLEVDAGIQFLCLLGENYPRLRQADTGTLRQVWQQAGCGHPIALKVFAMLTRRHLITTLLSRTSSYQDELGEWIEELFKGLTADEVRTLRFLSIFRAPLAEDVLAGLLNSLSGQDDGQSTNSVTVQSLDQPVNRFLVEQDANDRIYLHPLLKEFAYRSLDPQQLARYHRRAGEHYNDCLLEDQDDLSNGLEAYYHYKRSGAGELAARIVMKIKAGLFGAGQFEQLAEFIADIEPFTCEFFAQDSAVRDPILFLGGGELAHAMIRAFDPELFTTIVVDKLTVASGDADYQMLLDEEMFRNTGYISSLLRKLGGAISRTDGARPPMIFTDYYGFDAEHVFQVAESLGYRLLPSKTAALVAADKVAFWEFFRRVPEVEPSLIPRSWLAIPAAVARQLRDGTFGPVVKDAVRRVADEMRAVGPPCVLKLANSELGYGQSIVRSADEALVRSALKFAVDAADRHGINPGDRMVIEREIRPPFWEVVVLAVRHLESDGAYRTTFAPPIIVRHASEEELLPAPTDFVRGPFVLDLAIQCASDQLPQAVLAQLPDMQRVVAKMVSAIGDSPGIYGVGCFVTQDRFWIADDLPVKAEDTMFVTEVQRDSAAGLLVRCLSNQPIPAEAISQLAFAGGTRTLLWRDPRSVPLERIDGRAEASEAAGIYDVRTYESKTSLRPLRLMGIVFARLPADASRPEIEACLDKGMSKLRIIPREQDWPRTGLVPGTNWPREQARPV